MIWLPLIAAIGIIVYLGIRVSQLSRLNKRLLSRLVEFDEMKKNFMSHVSHELKAPLASMQETTQVMLEGIPGPLTEKQHRLLDLNMQSGKRLSKMIGNILDLSRLLAGVVDYDMQITDIKELMDGTVQEMSGYAGQKSLELQMEIQGKRLFVECDPNRMVQLFTNLLENAIRFSNRSGSIGVHLTALRNAPPMPPHANARVGTTPGKTGFALVEILDCGPGVEDSLKEVVFLPFHQAKSGKKARGESLGLGLAIARAIVEAHRGTIWVRDNPAGGAVFCVLLPCTVAAEAHFAEAS